MTSRAPWLSHYDPGVPPSLAPYPSRTLLDYVADAARQHPDVAGRAVQGGRAHLRRDRRAQRRVRLGARRARRQTRRTGRSAAAELPAVPDCRIGSLESRRDRRTAQPDLYRERARGAAARARHRDDRDADALLSARQARPAEDAAHAGDRDQHQGALSAAAPVPFHARARAEGGRPGPPGAWRPRTRGAPRRPSRAAGARRTAFARGSGGAADERRHDRDAQGRARHTWRVS